MLKSCLTIACLCLALLCSPGLAQTTAASDDVTAPTETVAVEPVARDGQIATRILDILQSTGWYVEPEVTVNGGIVFLDGRARSTDHRVWARELASNTQGVVAVVNRIVVEQELTWSFAPALAELDSLLKRMVTSLPLILLTLVILPLTWWLSGLASKGLRRYLLGRISSPFLKDIVSRVMALPIFLIGLYIVLQVAGLTQLAFSVVGGAGVLGIVVGFAFRDIAENFLASLLLSIRRPFESGDFIEVTGLMGSVRSMNTRSTVLISPEGNHIQIPNATIFKNTITNYTASPSRREVLSVGVGYDVSTARAQKIIQEVLQTHEAVLDEPAPMVLIDNLGSSTVNLKAYYWFDAKNYSLLKVKSALLRLVNNALTEAGVPMPDDAREVIFPQGVPVLQLDGAAAERAQAIATSEIAEASEEAEDKSEAEEIEGDLTNEQEEVTQIASETEAPTDDADLLSDKT
ncbi:mechanosensitive ion channel family protein [Litoreibacter roseus]|uniref:Small-conductance mechanosensitive channel n=1 Tax=Litoreibacter roseus TaxID=2601869 RepID=A0A6N6JFH8_9RHOB|nr:mechanosensitive ion channel family protein [Litoreibacter roseus]GFE64884.1 mechanosensitive ion channel protein MscS [Litoreibacter roseus]